MQKTYTYTLLPTQREFFRVDSDIKLDVCVYQGGYGSGKTWIGTLLGIMLCQKYPGILGLCVAKSHAMLADTTIRAYLEHLDVLDFRPNIDYTFKKSDSSLVFHCYGDSEILFRHLADPERVKSINAGFVEVEEMSMLEETDFNMLLSRLRQSGVDRYRLFGHTNPQASRGWLHKVFVEKNKGKIKLEDDTYMQFRRVIAATTENIHLETHYVASLKDQFDDAYYRINVLGEDGDYRQGLVCKSWVDGVNIAKNDYLEGLRIYLSCDFNVSPMCWAVAHRYNGGYYFFDEICLPATNTLECVEAFIDRYPTHCHGITITGDASGNNRSTVSEKPNDTDYTVLRNKLLKYYKNDVALDIPVANPLVNDRVMTWNSCVSNSRGVSRIKVDPRCKWLIWNCQNLHYIQGTSKIWEPTPREIEKSPNLQYVKHIWDAASYLVHRYDAIRKVDAPKRNNGVYEEVYQPDWRK